jgi:hypothetical protein
MRDFFLAAVCRCRWSRVLRLNAARASLSFENGVFASPLPYCLASGAVSPRKGQNVGNAVTVVAMNQSMPAHVVVCLTEPHDLNQPILHVFGEALLLLW